MSPTETTPKINMNKTFSAPIEKVFKAWTQGLFLEKWCCPQDYTTPHAETNLKVGGQFKITMKNPKGQSFTAVGTYKEIEAPQKLVFTWNWEDIDIEDTLITIELKSQGDKTEMNFTHEKFPDQKIRDQHDEGWAGCFDNLIRFFNS